MTTYLSWRVGFLLEVVVIVVVLANIRMVHDVEYTGARRIDLVGAGLSVLGMGGVVLGILVWQEGGQYVGALIAAGVVALTALSVWLRHRKQEGKLPLIDPDLFGFPHFRLGISQQMMQQVLLGGAMIALPIFLQMKLEFSAMRAGLALAPLSLSMFAVALLAGRRAGNRRASDLVLAGFLLATLGMALLVPLVPRTDFGRSLVIPLLVAGCGLGLLVSQLNNYTLAPIEEERVSEAAGVNSAAGSFGLSFGLAVAGGLMLASLSVTFGALTSSSEVIPPTQQEQIAQVLEEDAQVMSDTQLRGALEGQPEDVRREVLSINDDARDRALQVALLVPVLAGLLGLYNSFRMRRLPDIRPVARTEGLDLG